MYKPLATEAHPLNWNVYDLVQQNDRKVVDFSVPIQRGYIRNLLFDSLLVHSILIGIPIRDFYFNHVESIYQGLEGKQRNKALYGFVKNLYALHPDTPPAYTDEGEFVPMTGMMFRNLPPDLQNRILRFSLQIFWFNNASVDDQILIFTRLNSGKPVTPADIARIKVKSRKDFIILAEHDGIATIAKEKVIMENLDEIIAENIWIMANVPKPNLSTNFRGPLLEKTKVPEEQIDEVKHALDYMLAFYRSIEDKRLFSRLRGKVHIESLAYMGIEALRGNMTEEEYIRCAIAFVTTDGSKTTRSEKYNQASLVGIGQTEQVRTRMTELKKALT